MSSASGRIAASIRIGSPPGRRRGKRPVHPLRLQCRPPALMLANAFRFQRDRTPGAGRGRSCGDGCADPRERGTEGDEPAAIAGQVLMSWSVVSRALDHGVHRRALHVRTRIPPRAMTPRRLRVLSDGGFTAARSRQLLADFLGMASRATRPLHRADKFSTSGNCAPLTRSKMTADRSRGPAAGDPATS